MCRLICAFVVHIWQKQVFSWRGSYVSNSDVTHFYSNFSVPWTFIDDIFGHTFKYFAESSTAKELTENQLIPSEVG